MANHSDDDATALSIKIENAETRIRQATSKQEACSAFLDAAELYLMAMKFTPDHNEKKKFDRRCRYLLDQTERAKSASQWPLSLVEADSLPVGPNTASMKLEAPVPQRSLSTREKIILLEGSKLNGLVFPPWETSPDPTEFDLKPGEALFEDLAEYRLSTLQLDELAGWRRPGEALLLAGDQDQKITALEFLPTMTAHTKIDLVQDITTDCSVVASLCAGCIRAERGYSQLISSILYPYDHSLTIPAMSPNGKYVVRLHFNGCDRKVVIDDRLPASRTSRTLHVIDRANPGLLWPALLEKAYLKVRGGYDFPGSNSGTDLWIMTGWIPEQLFLQSEDVVPTALWRRLYNAFNYGDVLLTMGTGELTANEEGDLGLASRHDYAVIDMKDIDNRRRLLIKNPWARGKIWTGGVQVKSLPEQGEGKDGTSNGNTKLDSLLPGTFWMDLNDILQSFESVYLNWNPGLFKYRENVHFTWSLDKTSNTTGCFDGNPQFEINANRGGTTWLLLSRHFKTAGAKTTDGSKDDSISRNIEASFMSLYAFNNGGKRVSLSDGALARSPYVDAPNNLLRLELPRNSQYTIVVSEQALPRSNYNFTLSAFSLSSVAIAPAINRYSHCTTHHGAWTHESSGGNVSSSQYSKNPQFSIQLSKASDIALLVQSSRDEFPVHVKLVWANGKRVARVTTRDIAGDSGEYRRGSALAEVCNVQPGKYTIVCSTFEQNQLGTFTLRVKSMSDHIVNTIPSEGAGRLTFRLPLACFSPGVDRLIAPIRVHRVTRIRMEGRGRVTKGSGHNSPLMLALEHGQGHHKYFLATSGEGDFEDHHDGIRTGDVDISPQMCIGRGTWIAVERLGGLDSELHEEVEVETYSDNPIEAFSWQVGEADVLRD